MVENNYKNLPDEGGTSCVAGEEIKASKKEKNAPIVNAAGACALLSVCLALLAKWCLYPLAQYHAAFAICNVILSCLYFALGISAIVCAAIALAKHRSKRSDAIAALVVGCIMVVIKAIMLWGMLTVIYG